MDDSSFEMFYAATVQQVFDSMRRAAGGDKHLAHDAVQDAYVVMLRRWPERCARTVVENRRYVIGIASNKLADAYRRRGRFDDLETVMEVVRDRGGTEFEGVIAELSLFQAVRDVVAAQPPRRRLVGVLFFLEDHSYDEIAAMLELASSTVRTHVERLRQQLRPLVARLADGEQGGDWS